MADNALMGTPSHHYDGSWKASGFGTLTTNVPAMPAMALAYPRELTDDAWAAAQGSRSPCPLCDFIAMASAPALDFYH